MLKKGYWIAHVNITNPERYQDYIAANAVAFRKYNARFLVRAGQCVVAKGDLGWPQARRDRVRQLCRGQGLL